MVSTLRSDPPHQRTSAGAKGWVHQAAGGLPASFWYLWTATLIKRRTAQAARGRSNTHRPGPRGERGTSTGEPCRTRPGPGVRGVGRPHGLVPGEVALAWLLTRPGITGPAIGPGSLGRLESAVRAVQLRLPEGLLTSLEEIFPGPGPSPEAFRLVSRNRGGRGRNSNGGAARPPLIIDGSVAAAASLNDEGAVRTAAGALDGQRAARCSWPRVAVRPIRPVRGWTACRLHARRHRAGMKWAWCAR